MNGAVLLWNNIQIDRISHKWAERGNELRECEERFVEGRKGSFSTRSVLLGRTLLARRELLSCKAPTGSSDVPVCERIQCFVELHACSREIVAIKLLCHAVCKILELRTDPLIEGMTLTPRSLQELPPLPLSEGL